MKRRNVLLTTNALISAALVAVLLVALNYLGTEHHVRWDLTATREHSLSPQTIKILRTLPGPIQAVAFPSADSASRYRDFLETYRYYSRDFQYRIVDPDRNPAEAQKYKITSYGQIVLERGKATYTVDDATEQALTGKGFDVKPLYLVKTGQVPDDAAAVIVPSPTKDLLPQELGALDRYYRGGGKLLIMVDPQTPAGVRAWLGSEFHVRAPGGLVIDPVSRLLGGDFAVPIVTQYPYNDITQNFTLATAFPVSTPLEPEAKVTTVTITPIAKSSDASYVKVNLNSRDIRFQPGVDRKGPAILAVEVVPNPSASSSGSSTAGAGKSPAAKPAEAAAKAATAAPKGSAVLFGNSAFVRNAYIGLVGNRDLFTSAVAWLTQSGNLVSIAPRASPFDPFIVTGRQGRLLFLGSVVALPLALLVLGGTVYLRRRSL